MAFISSQNLRELLEDLKLAYSDDPAVISLCVFLEQHVPPAVALSNCMESAKSADLETQQLAFDALYHVLLPAMAHSFHLLKSAAYRYYHTHTY